MVLRNVIIAMLFVAASSQGLGQSQDIQKTADSNYYERLDSLPFTGTPEALKSKYELIAARYKYVATEYPKQAKLANKKLADLNEAIRILGNPDPKVTNAYDLKLASEIFGFKLEPAFFQRRSMYFALGMSPFEKGEVIQNRIDEVVDRITKAADGVGGVQGWKGIPEILQKLRNFKEIMGVPQKRSHYDREMAKGNPLTKNMTTTGKVTVGVSNFLLGSAYFMGGQLAYTEFEGWWRNDPALRRSATSLSGVAGLFWFGVPSQIVSTGLQKVGAGHQISNFGGMPIGSIASELETKYVGTKGWRLFKNNFHEYYDTILERLGLLETYRDSVREKIEWDKSKLNIPDPAVQKQAQDDIKKLQFEYNHVSGQTDVYRKKWFDAMDESYHELITFAPGEAKTLGVNAGRVFLDSAVLAIVMKTFQGLRARAIVRDKYEGRTMSVMSEKELAEYKTLKTQIADLDSVRVIDVKAFESNKIFMNELRSTDAKRVALFQANFLKSVKKQLGDRIEGLLGTGSLQYNFKKARSYFYPDLTDLAQGEITSQLGRRVILGQILPQALLGALNAVQFLWADEVLKNMGRNFNYGFSLQHDVETAVQALAYDSNTYLEEGSSKDLKAIDDAFDLYDKAWDDYLTNVVSNEAETAVAMWEAERKAHGLDLYYKNKWSAWLLNSVEKNHLDSHGKVIPDYTDADFLQNNAGDPNDATQQWHADLSTPRVLEGEKEYYEKFLVLLTARISTTC